jgi:hypothetical protein
LQTVPAAFTAPANLNDLIAGSGVHAPEGNPTPFFSPAKPIAHRYCLKNCYAITLLQNKVLSRFQKPKPISGTKLDLTGYSLRNTSTLNQTKRRKKNVAKTLV